MKPGQYLLLSWFTEIFGDPDRHTVVEPGEELPESFEGQTSTRVGEFEMYALDGGKITRKNVIAMLPVPGVENARLIKVDEDGPQVQQVMFEADGRRICVQRMVISMEDLLGSGEVD